VPTSHVTASYERTRESVLVQVVPPTIRRHDSTQLFKSLSVTRPRVHSLFTTPRELLASLTMVPRPKRSIPFVKTDDALNPLERSPRRPRGALGHFVSQRRSIQSVRRVGVRVERAGVKDISFVSGASAD
jgi:hypothetical protein